ncbi:MAG TPA: M1 family metallopeptidase [Steroidobacteraceae bacterium]|nr:M1 family metallopeptidase [Steroidobacteraceae bacterium]
MAARHVFGDPAVTQRPPTPAYHVQNYKMTLRFDEAKGEVFGDEMLRLVPLRSGFSRFYLDSSDLTVQGVTLRSAAGRDVPLQFETAGSRLWITLNRAYGPGEVLHVAIRYYGFPRAGLYFVQPDAAHPDAPPEIWSQGEPEFNHHWFPCWDYPNDMSASETVVTVPRGQSVVSNGKLVSVVTQGDQVTFDWVEAVPHSAYLTSIAVGPWRKVSDHYGALPVDYYVPASVNAATARRSFHLTPDMIGFFSGASGVPWPYEKYSQVTVSHYFFGGMENVSATTLTDATLHDTRADVDYPSQALVAHELGQEWFGDLVQGRDWADIWLNEGFATYLEALYTQYHEGNDAFRLEMMQNQETAQSQDRNDYLRPIVDDHYAYPLQMFDGITHEKGAVVLDMLRNILDGQAAAARSASQQELFFRALRAYLTEYRAQAVDTQALIRALETATGRNLDGFFREWVYMAGQPDYRVTARYDSSTRTETLEVAQTQDAPGVAHVFVMPIELDFHGAHGQSQRVIVNDRERVQQFKVALDFEPLWIDFDPHDVIEKSLVFKQPLAALVAKARDDPAMMSRLSAVEALGSVSGKDTDTAVLALSARLRHDGFYGVRVYAARGLGEIHTPAAKAALLGALAQSDGRVRAAAVAALAIFKGDPEVYHALLGRLDGDASYAVEAAAAAAIGTSGAANAFSVLARVAGTAADSHVVAGVLEGLAATGDPRAFAILLTDARPGKPETLRRGSLTALEQAGAISSGSVHEALLAALRAALDDQDLSIRLTGEEVAGALSLAELRPDIEKLARTAPTAFEQDAADQALQQLRGP